MYNFWRHRRAAVIRPKTTTEHEMGSVDSSNSALLPHTAHTPPTFQSETRHTRPGPKPLASAKPILSRISGLSNLRSMCLLLHLSLLVIHILLFVVWKSELEHKVVFSLGRESDSASTAITLILQSLGTVYSTLMVYTAQQLVMRKQLSRPTTVTAMHDNNTAWSGIGSGLSTLWRNICLPASVPGPLLAVLYLGSISVFHITTPALLSVQAFNTSFPFNLTLSGLPDYRSQSTKGGYHVISQDLVGFVQALPETNTVGLRNGTIYEIPTDSPLPGIINVSATYFNISCGSSLNITEDLDIYTSFSAAFNGTGCDWNSDHNFCNLSPNATLLLVTVPVDNTTDYTDSFMIQSEDILVVSSSIYSDSDGEVGSVLHLDPPINYTRLAAANEYSFVPELQFMRCQLTLNHLDAAIDAQTKLPVSPLISPLKSHSQWLPSSQIMANYSFTESQISESVDLSLITMWAWQLFLDSNTPRSAQASITPQPFIAASESCVEENPGAECSAFFTPMEISLMITLGLRPDMFYDGGSPSYDGPQNLTLHDLENALSQMHAARFWADANMPLASTDAQISGEATPHATRSVEVELPLPAARLTISSAALTVGLVTTTILLLLSIALCHHQKPTVPGQPDSLGILQVLWLFRNQPDVYEAMVNVDEPTIDNLRVAGITAISNWVEPEQKSRKERGRARAHSIP